MTNEPTKNATAAQAKILIPLRGSARVGTLEHEAVWADDLGDGLYKVWNIPFWAFNIEMTDIVRCRGVEGSLPEVVAVVEKGSCLCLRLGFHPSVTDDDIHNALDRLAQRKAILEKGSRTYWAVGMRSVEDFNWVGEALSDLVTAGKVFIESVLQPDEPEFDP